MDGLSARNWPRGAGLALAGLLLLSLLSFDLNDPTLTNLRLPGDGISNALGLPGALLGGSLLECFGLAALLVPLLIANRALCRRNRPPLWRYALHGTLLTIALAGLHGIAGGSIGPGLESAGLAGWTLGRWAALTTGPWLGAALCGYVAAYAANRVLYAPVVAAARRDAATFAGFFARGAAARGFAAWRGVRAIAGAVGAGVHALAATIATEAQRGIAGLAALLWWPFGAIGRGVQALRPSALRRVKARRGYGSMPVRAAAAGAEAAGGDAFEAWFTPIEEETLAVEGPRRSTEETRGRSPAARAPDAGEGNRPSRPPAEREAPGDYRFESPEAEAAWRAQLQRYARSTELDWSNAPWRRRRRQEDGDTAEPSGGEDH